MYPLSRLIINFEISIAIPLIERINASGIEELAQNGRNAW